MHILRIFIVLLTGIMFQITYAASAEDADEWSTERFRLYTFSPQKPLKATREELELLTQRKKVADTILKVYQLLNKNGRHPEIIKLEDGTLGKQKVSVPNWESLAVKEEHLKKPDGTYPTYCFPPLKRPVEASWNDLRNPLILDGPSAELIACGHVFYNCARTTDKEWFVNPIQVKLLKSEGEKFSSGRHAWMSGGIYFYGMESTKGIKNPQVADRVYIPGHPNYLKQHPLGSFSGENVFFVGYDSEGFKRYIGFGPLFQKGPLRASKIQRHLAQSYLARHPLEEVGIEYSKEDEEDAYAAIRDLQCDHNAFKAHLLVHHSR